MGERKAQENERHHGLRTTRCSDFFEKNCVYLLKMTENSGILSIGSSKSAVNQTF